MISGWDTHTFAKLFVISCVTKFRMKYQIFYKYNKNEDRLIKVKIKTEVVTEV